MNNKILLTLVAIFTILTVNAQTIFLKPGDPLNYELKVDTVKYPELKKVDVNWYLGFDNVIKFSQYGAEFSAMKVDDIITMDDGSKVFHLEKIPVQWGTYTTSRTAYLFYVHKTETKSSGKPGDGNTYYTKDEFDGWTCDTTANFHILKELGRADLRDWTLNGEVNAKVTEGDTVKVKVTVADPLDVQTYILAVDDEVVAAADTNCFEFVPTFTMEDIHLIMTNSMCEYDCFKDLASTRSITLYPQFTISNVIYTAVTKPEYTETGDKVTKTVEGNTNVEVLNHDSVTITVSTNIKETIKPTSVKYSWNKDGKLLPDGVNTKNNQLIIPEYNKETMDGVYNCHITANDVTLITTFNVTSSFPTANESISNNEFSIVTDKNLLTITSKDKSIKVINSTGNVLFNKVSSYVNLNLPTGVYIVIVDGKSHKILVK